MWLVVVGAVIVTLRCYSYIVYVNYIVTLLQAAEAHTLVRAAKRMRAFSRRQHESTQETEKNSLGGAG